MHHESRNDAEIIRMHGDSFSSRFWTVDGAARFTNSWTLLVSKSLHTLEHKIIIHNIRKGWSELQGCSQWTVFTLIWRHKSILSRGEITDSAERTSALLHQHLSVSIKTRVERHLLLKSTLRIHSREKRDLFGRSQNPSTIAALLPTHTVH